MATPASLGPLPDAGSLSVVLSTGSKALVETIRDRLTAIRDKIPEALTTSGSLKAAILEPLPGGTNTIGKVDQGAGGASPWAVSASALPLPDGAATASRQDDAKGVLELVRAAVEAARDRLPGALTEAGELRVAVTTAAAVVLAESAKVLADLRVGGQAVGPSNRVPVSVPFPETQVVSGNVTTSQGAAGLAPWLVRLLDAGGNAIESAAAAPGAAARGLVVRIVDGTQVALSAGAVVLADLRVNGNPVASGNPVPAVLQPGSNSIGSVSLSANVLGGAPAVVRDLDTDANTTTNVPLVGIGLPAAGGPAIGGTASAPLRVNPTGETPQPITAAALPLPANAAKETGGNLAELVTKIGAGLATALSTGGGAKVGIVDSVALVLAAGNAAIGSVLANLRVADAAVAVSNPVPTRATNGSNFIDLALDATLLAVRDRLPSGLGQKAVGACLAVVTSIEDAPNGLMPFLPKPIPSPTYAWTLYRNAGQAASANIKGTAGNVGAYTCRNTGTSTRFFQIWSSATVAGAPAPLVWEQAVPAGSSIVTGSETLGLAGVHCSAGIAFGFSTTSNTYTAGTPAEQTTQVLYK